jgi:hypothetical protein
MLAPSFAVQLLLPAQLMVQVRADVYDCPVVTRTGKGLAGLAMAAAVLTVAPSATAVTAKEAIASLTAQRAANGIPAGLKEVKSWSHACALHNAYQIRNGGNLTHDEVKGSPGYTKLGAWAGHNSVLSFGLSWATGNPWEDAPIHLSQTLAPRLTKLGVDERDNFICATTLAGRLRAKPRSIKVYTYPGNGVHGVRTSETAAEAPYTPGQRVGIRARTTTGPYILILVDGPFQPFERADIKSARLASPAGAVRIKTADGYTSGLGGGLIPPGGFIIPVEPLAPNTSYTATVKIKVIRKTVTKRFSFTTAE